MNIPSIIFILLLGYSFSLSKYKLSNVSYLNPSLKTKINGTLLYESPNTFNPSEFSCSQLRNPNNIKLITNLSLSLSLEYDDMIHVRITDRNNIRWEPKNVLNPKYEPMLSSYHPKKSLANFGFRLYNNSFGFELYNTTTNQVYYTFSNNTFLYSDTLIIFESMLTSNDIYGFGERAHEFKLSDGVYTIWPNDTGGIHYDNGRGAKNGYGHQPIGLHKTQYDNIFLGFVFINTNMQDVVIKTISKDKASLKHITIGGIIDYYIIVGDSPDNVVKRIHFLLGVPILPPFWSLGWHHSRYGYKNLDEVKRAYTEYKTNKIPIDTLWVDIDTLDKKKIFTIDSNNFKNLPKFIETIHNEHSHFVPIVDIGISYEDDNFFVKIGKKLNTFIKSNYTKEVLISKVWPGKTVFPDFYNPNTTLLWNYGLKKYEEMVHFDGIWLDMNEPAMIETDKKCIGEIADNCPPERNYYYYATLPYIPGYIPNEHTDIATSSINENALLYGKNQLLNAAYNTKPMISYIQSKVTYDYLYLTNKRPFILTRGNSIGIGKYAFHWLGDNFSKLNSMKYGISAIFTFNIFGIPITGDDICGFFENTNDALCSRWHNLGAFYPFSRNHNFIYSKSNEPWDVGAKSLASAKKAIPMRYSILRYIYSELFLISLNEKGSFFKPVLFEYPNDKESYNNIDNRIMIGSSFILFPGIQIVEKSISAIFPNDNWNTFPDMKPFINKGDSLSKSLSGDFESIHLFLRGGSIIPYQDTTSEYIQNTYVLRQKPIQIIINPDENDKAKGTIFYDNDDKDTIALKKYIRIDLSYQNKELIIEYNSNRMKQEEYAYKDNVISKVVLLRYEANLKKKAIVSINDEKKSIDIIIDNSSKTATVDLSSLSVTIDKLNSVSF